MGKLKNQRTNIKLFVLMDFVKTYSHYYYYLFFSFPYCILKPLSVVMVNMGPEYAIGLSLSSLSQHLNTSAPHHLNTSTPLPGVDPGILIRGGVDFFFKGIGSGGRLKTQWVQGSTLVGATGAKPPAAPEFW